MHCKPILVTIIHGDAVAMTIFARALALLLGLLSLPIGCLA
jgi:hypothetical protein